MLIQEDAGLNKLDANHNRSKYGYCTLRHKFRYRGLVISIKLNT